MRSILRFITIYLVLSVVTAYAEPDRLIRALIVDGPQRFHNFQRTTPILKEILEKSGRFEVDLSRSSEESVEDGSYKPDFHLYDVVVINEGFGANPWPEATQRAFEEYIAGGGAMVSYHAANNAWPEWEAYNRMTGLGGWAGRNAQSGPYLYIDDDGEIIRDYSRGGGGSHGPQHVYEIDVREHDHPIMQGLPATFEHGPDELYDSLRGPAENVTILASAYSSKEHNGSGRHEPVLMTIQYGEGRIFHTVLGHGPQHIRMGSFITTFQRGTEWAATGEVTIPVPEDFPNQEF